MKIEINRPGQAKALRIKKFLYNLSDDFETPLRLRLNLENYSIKLATLAYNLFAVRNVSDVGHSAFYLNYRDSSLFVSSIAVVKTYRRKRLGSLLISRIEEFSRDHNITNIKLEAESRSSEVDQFYRKNGFNLIENFYTKKL